MRLTPSDPDIQTIVARIEDQSIDLQPNFQRGEIWSIPKRQRLVDSILRDWHVPPIHVVIDNNNRQLVLDGQQRLAAIRDFSNNLFPVDGNIQPIDPSIKLIHGLHFNELPEEWRRKFNQFTLRLFRITDYHASEPGELFFRLNQPSALTAAEQRNAFFGKAREQVKHLVERMLTDGLNDRFWNFTNARMAYDDIIARTCYLIEGKSLKRKITSTALADRYRSEDGFADEVISRVKDSISLLSKCKDLLQNQPSFNKATAQSWLTFLACLINDQYIEISPEILAKFIDAFNSQRVLSDIGIEDTQNFGKLKRLAGNDSISVLMKIYEDRATSRVADVSSVVLRDFTIWVLFWAFTPPQIKSGGYLKRVSDVFNHNQGLWPEGPSHAAEFENLTIAAKWGESL